MLNKYITRITTIILFYFTLSVINVYCQTPADNPGNNCVILRIDYCSNWITTSYGDNKKIETRIERDKKLPIKDQIGYINNILADALNKLEKEGYRVVTSASDGNQGTTCGLTFILYKNQ